MCDPTTQQVPVATGPGFNTFKKIWINITTVPGRRTTIKDSGVLTPKSKSVCVNERFKTYLHDKITYTCIYS